ncbi:hypothetical protein GGR01_000955 [Acetobacter oeni]|nr:hypothetical protein [Acetobacter oeni]
MRQMWGLSGKVHGLLRRCYFFYGCCCAVCEAHLRSSAGVFFAFVPLSTAMSARCPASFAEKIIRQDDVRCRSLKAWL